MSGPTPPDAATPTLPRPRVRIVAVALFGLWVATFAAWLASALGQLPPAAVSRAVVAAAVGLSLVEAFRTLGRLVTGRASVPAATGRWLAVVLLAALVLAFVGLDHEVTGRDYGDEGTYRANAERINDGWLLRPNFIYPHLLYYLDAIALWGADLFPGPTRAAAGSWGVEGDLAVASLVTRMVTALLAALTVLPVFAIGRRVAGDGAGLVGAVLLAVCPLWVSNAHLNLSDVPAAVFATGCLAAVAALLDRERLVLYAAGGLAAGLAAGSKYPAGVVAIALVAIWLRWRVRSRRWGWGLVLAGGSALAAFLATTPSLLAFPEAVFAGEGSKDILFGARLYATRGWAGIVHQSNVGYYGDQLVRAFGWPALLLGSLGIAALGSRERRRLAWLLAFPAAYLLLLFRLQVGVPRNLLPVVPILAVTLGCGMAAAWRTARGARRLRPVAAAALVAALAVPAWGGVREATLLARPTTRQVADRWLEASLPPGSFLVQEAYTPPVRPPLFSRRPRFVTRLEPDELRDPKHDYALLASEAYGRFFRARNRHRPELTHQAARYREIFDTLPLVREFRPGPWRRGPVLRLYRLDPEPVEYRTSRQWASSSAVLPDDAMRGARAVRYTLPGQWSLYKEYLEAGSYAVRVEGRLTGPGRVVLRDRTDPSPRQWSLDGGGRGRLELRRPEKAFVYVYAPEGSRVTGVAVRRAGARGEAP